MTNFLQIGPGCSGNFWTNPNITASTGMLNVARPAVISIVVRNTGGERVRINAVQATVCAWNTLHSFNSASILPSLAMHNGLTWDNVFPFPDDVVLQPGGSVAIELPSWTPQSSDIHHFDSVPGAAFEDLTKTNLHACVFANCLGSHPPVMTGEVIDDGARINWGNVVGATNFCADTHHGQHNLSLQRLKTQMKRITVPFYAGLGVGQTSSEARVSVTQVRFDPKRHPAIVEMIERDGLAELPVHVAERPATVAGLARFRSEPGRDGEGEFGEGVSPQLDLKLSPMELVPLMLKLEADAGETGAVHIFDVVQVNSDDTKGGFRLAAICVPDEVGSEKEKG